MTKSADTAVDSEHDPRRAARPYLSLWGFDRFADTVFETATTWYVVRHSGSPAIAGAVIGASYLPALPLTLFGGALGDRKGLTWMAQRTLIARVVLFAAVVVAFYVKAPWSLVIAAAVLMTVLDSFHFSPLRGLSGSIAGPTKEDQQQMQGHLMTWGKVGQAAAGPVVGILIAVSASTAATPGLVAVVVACVLMSAVTRSLGPIGPSAGAPDDENASSVIGDIKEAFGDVWSRVGERLRLIILSGANMLTVGPILLAVPLKAARSDWSWWESAVAFGGPVIGAALGGLTVKTLMKAVARVDVSSLVMSCACLVPCAAGVALLSVTDSSYVVGVGGLIAGIFAAWTMTLVGGDLFHHLPEEYHGRLSSFMEVATYSLTFVGQAAFGLAAAIDERASGAAFAVILALLAVVGASYARRLPADS